MSVFKFRYAIFNIAVCLAPTHTRRGGKRTRKNTNKTLTQSAAATSRRRIVIPDNMEWMDGGGRKSNINSGGKATIKIGEAAAGGGGVA